MKYIFILIFLLSTQVYAQKSSGGSKARKIFSTGIMVLNSSTTQGGSGPSGSTILTQSEFIWAYNRFGFGAVFNYDLHGSNEKDSSYGIKFEGYLSKFYLELAYLISAKRAYTDRSISSETGTGLLYGVGVRIPVSNKTNGFFFHASYKVKTQTLTDQDGTSLSESIVQTDGYPIIGFGFSF